MLAPQFFAACREGDLRSVKRHLRHDRALLLRTNALGNSALHLACEFGHAPLASFLFQQGHAAHLTRRNESGLCPADLGLDALLQSAGDVPGGSAAAAPKRRKRRRSASGSSSSSDRGYRDPHAAAAGGGGADERAAAQWRQTWEQERADGGGDWAARLAEEAAAEDAEWGGGGTGMAWGDQWAEDEEQAERAQEDWMDALADEMRRKRAAEAQKRSESRKAKERPPKAGGADGPRPTTSGIPGSRPGVGSGGGAFAGMRNGPTKENAAVSAARLDKARRGDDQRWEDFVKKFGAAAPAKANRGPTGVAVKQQKPEPQRAPKQAADGPPLTPDDIPWPAGLRSAGDNVLSLAPSLSAAEVKKLVRTAQLRWHPDKFSQRFSAAMSRLVGGEAAAAAVLEKVKDLAQQINAIDVSAADVASDEHVGPARPPAT